MARRRRKSPENAAVFVSVEQAISVLDVLAAHPTGLMPEELSTATQMPVWTVERVVASLVEAGVVASRPRPRLSLKLVALAYRFMWTLDWKYYYMDPLEELSRTTGELAQIAVVNHDSLVVIDKVEGKNALRVASVIGTDVPLHATAGGKLWLANLSGRTRDRVLAGRPLVAFTEHTITDRGRLVAELSRIRAQGYAAAHEEYYPGVSAVAAPIRPEEAGPMIGAVSLAFPAGRPDEEVARYAQATVACAERLREFGIRVHEELGGKGARPRPLGPGHGPSQACRAPPRADRCGADTW
jgi:IclR family acetate operon transcriptional repressor